MPIPKKLDDGRWQIRWRDPPAGDGSRKARKATFERKASADIACAEIHDATKLGRIWEPRGESAGEGAGVVDVTVRACMSAYVDHLTDRRAARTAINVGVACDLFTAFAGESMPITAMTKTKLDAFYKHLRTTIGRNKKPRSKDTCAKYITNVQGWWKWAANQDAYASIIPPPRELEALPRDAQMPTKAPTWAEMDATIAAAGAWYPLLLAVMRSLGLRVSQALFLKVGDLVRTDAGLELHFRGELGKSAQERRGRIVPIGSHVAWFFNEMARDRPASEFLVPSMRAVGRLRSRDLQSRHVNHAWEKAGVRAEVWKKRPDHAFRKGFETGLRAAGVERDAAEYLVGHSLGIAGLYVDAVGLGLRGVVDKIPPFSDAARARLEAAMSECVTRKAAAE